MNGKLPADSVLKRAYETEDKESLYDSWAADYDDDLELQGYVGPRHAVELLQSISPDAATVMDFGCGSGLVAEQLAIFGYEHIDGVDISKGMLERAASREIYRSLRQHDLSTSMRGDETYEAGICVGVCAFGPINADHIAHMTGVLAADAPLVITINAMAWDESNWAQQLDDAQTPGQFTVEYIKTIPYLVDTAIDAKLLVIRNSSPDSIETCQPEMHSYD